MSETPRQHGTDDQLLNSLFGTPEDLDKQSTLRWEEAQRERTEMIIEMTVAVEPEGAIYVTDDEWEESDL